MKKKIFIIINDDWFFLSHRKEVAKAALEAGFEVTLIARDSGKRAMIENMGIHFIDFPVDPVGTNLFHELQTLWWLYRTFKREKPDIVHLVGLKCMLWGALAARWTHVGKIVNAVSGLGIIFSSATLGVMARCILMGLRMANSRKKSFFIFQNNDDKELFKQHRIMQDNQCYFTKGSGVDLTEFSYAPEQLSGKVCVIYTGRMVREKGVCDLIAAAEKLRSKYADKVEFWLCGGLHDNPKALSADELHELCDGQYIQWLGFCKNIKELLQRSHIVAFPSYYREGIPKSLIEAAAIGRPIVTCDSVGCREVVQDGVNGFLIKPRDVDELVARLSLLIDDAQLRAKMGQESRKFAEHNFAIEDVVATHLQIYKR